MWQRMNRRAAVASLLVASLLCFDAEATTEVRILSDAGPAGDAVAAEFAAALGKIYTDAQFHVGPQAAGKRPTHVIRLGTRDSLSDLLNNEKRAALATPGSFVVFTPQSGDVPTGCIVGADLEGIWNGVYGLLKKLGCGFYLSFDSAPPRPAGAFSFAGWELRNRPLVPVRMVFNWHNFLSGCSTWNLEHWRRWIVQSQKMGYNALMVHAYGNNPMAGFTLDGRPKPVGYLASTRLGRDWNTNHVQDVRRLVGGHVFDDPVFGSSAAVAGTDAQRTAAAQKLMSDAFDVAQTRGMKVYFAFDVDTYSANPQELVKRLPERARFVVRIPGDAWLNQPAGPFWMPNPDTPEGYAFYRDQVKYFLKAYPQVDVLVVWHRGPGGMSPWVMLRRKDLPRPWQEEFSRDAQQHPNMARDENAAGMFAVGKIVRAIQRAIAESDRRDVRIASGTWGTASLALIDHYFPRDVTLLPLDYDVLRGRSAFEAAEGREVVARVARRREVIPIAWAHHDDGNYVGRPYTPAADFASNLADMACAGSGYGVIHWMTRPLDVYFASLANQAWEASRDEPLATTCRRMAGHMVGEAQADRFGDYLYQWATTAPKIGRETSDFFIDVALADPKLARAEMERRLKILEGIDLASLDATQRDWIGYFCRLEQAIAAIHEDEYYFRLAKKAYQAGDFETARRMIRKAKPEETVDAYAACATLGGISRGEQGIVVTLNTRWLSHYVRLRQQLRLDAVRYDFGPTVHERLAQSPGIHTFHFDPKQRLWEVLGQRETGSPAYGASVSSTALRGQTPERSETEIGATGLVSDRPIRFEIRPIMKLDSRRKFYRQPPRLAPGRYRLDLLFGPARRAGAKPVEIDVRVSAVNGSSGRHESAMTRRISAANLSGNGRAVRTESFDVHLPASGAVAVELVPVEGKAWISGAVLAPIVEEVGAAAND